MKKILQTAMTFLAGTILITGAYTYRCHSLQADIAKKILRFHVIANSDSAEDQQLKLKVRDKIGTYLQAELKGVEDLAECEQVVNANLTQIENCAKEVITGEGYAYPINATIADTEFPVKTYGDYTFPKGEYRALKVVIGEGKGQNWWCVMYPNLCFASSVYEVVDENAKKELQSVLTREDYEEIMAEGKIKVKFKYLDALFH